MMLFRDNLFEPQATNAIKDAYHKSGPFHHAVIEDAIQEDLLRQAREEINLHMRFKFEENVVCRVDRTTDLANISNPEEYTIDLLPSVIQIRNTLYSSQFLEWISHITCVGPLSGSRSSMAVNLYKPGDHLLVHDDCNPLSKTRRVSFILYLTDPDNEWRTEWGGGLRLYDSLRKLNKHGKEVQVTMPEWSRYITPCFNQLIFFAIQPGGTYHEVEEVYSSGDLVKDQERQRMAVSGWLHAAQKGDDGFDMAIQQIEMEKIERLHQLKSTVSEFLAPQVLFKPFLQPGSHEGPADNTLSEQDICLLSQYISPQYLQQEGMLSALRCFRGTSALRLQSFLHEDFAIKLKNYCLNIDVKCDDVLDTGDQTLDWRIAQPPEKHRYLYLESGRGVCGQASSLFALLDDTLQSNVFKKWLALVLGIAPSKMMGQHMIARRFRRGLDYILMDTYEESLPRLDFTIGMTCNDSDDMSTGGFEAYVYDERIAIDSMFAGKRLAHPLDGGCFCKIPVRWNEFSVVLRSRGMQCYVKYLSRAARSDRWDISGKVRLSDGAFDNWNVEQVH